MQLFRPAVSRVLTATLVVGALVLLGLAFRRPRPSALPLEGAQLAGMRGIHLEDAQPMPRFDDQRPPIVVAPPAQGRWTAWAVGMGQRQPLNSVSEPVDDVVRVRVQPPLPEGRWNLVLEDDNRLTHWPVRFTAPPVDPPAITALKAQAKAAAVDARPGIWTAAVAALPPVDQVAAHVEAARAWIRAGRLDEAGRQYELAAAIAGELGWVSEQAARLRAAAWTLYRQRRFGEALAALEQAEQSATDPLGHAKLDFLRGSIHRETGSFRAATIALEAALEGAKNLQAASFEAMVVDELGSLLSDMGQHQSAIELMSSMPMGRAAIGRRLGIRGWIKARANVTNHGEWGAIRDELLSALEYLEEPDARLIALCNLIEIELREGRLEAARGYLVETERIQGRFATLHRGLLRGDLLLRSGELDAAESMLASVRDAAKLGLETQIASQSWFKLGHVARRRGNLQQAVQRTFKSLDLLSLHGRRVAVSGARAKWISDRQEVIHTAVELALEMGEARRALSTLDATRAWVIRDLEARLRVERLTDQARADWLSAQGTYLKAREAFEAAITTCQRRPADERPACEARLKTQRATVEQRFDDLYAVLDAHAPSALTDVTLPTLPPGQALFTATRLDDRVVGFWLAGKAVLARDIDPAAPLAPFAAEMGQVEHLYIVAGGGLTPAQVLTDPRAQARPALTWSELPFAGLLTRPVAQADAPPAIIANPALDLPHAAAEGAAVQARVGGRLLAGDAAHREAVTQALQSGARLLHFAGHGALDAESPWQAHLVLADEARLTLADLLVATPRVGLVVLSGCQTGVRQALSRQHAVGLTDAFLLAGAHAVIATDRVIPDAGARAFIDLFYQSPDWARRPAAAFAHAIRTLRAAGNPIWSAFRYLGRA